MQKRKEIQGILKDYVLIMLFLKDIGFGAATVQTGREFHAETTREEKKKLRMFNFC